MDVCPVLFEKTKILKYVYERNSGKKMSSCERIDIF